MRDRTKQPHICVINAYGCIVLETASDSKAAAELTPGRSFGYGASKKLAFEMALKNWQQSPYGKAMR